MRNGNEACLTTTSMKSGHRSKVKVVLALIQNRYRLESNISYSHRKSFQTPLNMPTQNFTLYSRIRYFGNIPTVQFMTGIPRNTESKPYMIS